MWYFAFWQPDADVLDKIVAQLEQAYQESRQRLKQVGQEGGASGVVSGGIATPIKNENHSTFSPGVAVAAVTQQPEINKGISADSAGSTPSSFKGMTRVTKIMSMSWLSEKDFRRDFKSFFFF